MIDYGKYLEFKKEFYFGKYPHQRFGQAFMNTFVKDETNPELFYSTDDVFCQHLIETKYVTYGTEELTMQDYDWE